MTARSGPARRGGKRRAQISPEASQALKQAHAHKRAEAYSEAAPLFADLAKGAAAKGNNAMATHLAYQSAKCRFREGNLDEAMAQVELAVGHATAAQNPTKFARKFGRMIKALRARELEAQADQVSAMVQERMGLSKLPKQGDPPPVNRAMRRRLPKACASCGTRVDTAEIFFNDDSSADCRMCGSALTG
jgi:hypothetical protein